MTHREKNQGFIQKSQCQAILKQSGHQTVLDYHKNVSNTQTIVVIYLKFEQIDDTIDK